MPPFSVDTHLFRELGELLVGRDSTALIELIKNAYDADATKVIVYGEGLSDPEEGFIRITDDGVGMNVHEFTRGFLRIAARGKEEGKRRSIRFGRRYTGAKGVGRLAAHKLAQILEVISYRWDETAHRDWHALEGVEGVINWAKIENKRTLDEIEGTDAIQVEPLRAGRITKPGTTITLRRLRRGWSKTAHGRFLSELQTFRPADALTERLPLGTFGPPILFERPQTRDESDAIRHGFSVMLEGELSPPDEWTGAAAAAAAWVIEIDALTKTGAVQYGIAPSIKTSDEHPAAVRRHYSVMHPSPESGPFFQARVLVYPGRVTALHGKVDSGVRVYMEGFRVPPYGDSGNDWLELDKDNTRRDRGLLEATLRQSPFDNLAIDADPSEGLHHLPNRIISARFS